MTAAEQREAVAECLGSARDRLQSAHDDLNHESVEDAIFCVMRAVNHLAVAVDLLTVEHEDA